jgi:3-dehydroquinate dehydratase-1
MVKICVPITSTNDIEIIKEIKYINTLKLDMIEWRVDYYKDAKNIEKVKNILEKIYEETNFPILFTFRNKDEGGEVEFDKNYYLKLLKEIISTKKIDLVDIELSKINTFEKDLVDIAKKNNVKVLMSSHNFSYTPKKDDIIKTLCVMQENKADLAKIAVMPTCEEDVLTLLLATSEMKKKYAKIPIITVSMGKLGMISRIVGHNFGSSVTFASAKNSSAPGQINVEDLNEILKIISKE